MQAAAEAAAIPVGLAVRLTISREMHLVHLEPRSMTRIVRIVNR
jgi:hypothetical protein